MNGCIRRFILMGTFSVFLLAFGSSNTFGQSYDFQDPYCSADVGYSSGQGSMPSYPLTISIGALLVEFNDRQHHSNNYKIEDFENLLFSDDFILQTLREFPNHLTRKMFLAA